MKMKKVNDKSIGYILILSVLLIIILIFTFLMIKRYNGISFIKKKYDYVNKLEMNINYLSKEYDKLLEIANNNDEMVKNNMILEADKIKIENDIISLQEKISKMESVK